MHRAEWAGVLAHGLGGRTDLPIPRGLALYAAATAVIVSFAALGVLWPKPAIVHRTGRPWAARIRAAADSARLRRTLQLVTLLLCVFVVYVAFRGPAATNENIAPWLLYITFWVGLALLSVLFGPIWRVVNPLRLIHDMTQRFGGAPTREYPEQLGYWPAAIWLATFVWIELVLPQRGDPRVVGSFLVLYAAANLYGAAMFGSRWFVYADGFEVYSAMFARLSPFGRRDDGVLVVRNPLNGLATLRPAPGLVAVVTVIIGSTGFDGLTRTGFWRDNIDPDSLPLGTLGLAAMIATAAMLYLVAARSVGWLGSADARTMPGLFASSMLPIALGYTVAHYFSLFLLEGQRPLALVSDPLGTGDDLFGTASRSINYFLGTDLTAYTQLGAIVVGHIVAVCVAHERALTVVGGRDAIRSQYGLLLAMVAFTLGAITLLVSS